MRRRHFLAALGGAAASWPCLLRGKAGSARIGFLADGAEASINSAYQIRTIKRGLSDNGLVEHRDYLFDPRFAAGNFERFPEMARDLARAGARVLIANAVAAVRAAQQLDPLVAVVMCGVDSPAGNGMAASLAKPGGRTTGIVTESESLTPKMLEWQRAVLPEAASMALLYNPASLPAAAFMDDLRRRANALRIAIRPVAFASRNELEAAFGRLAKTPPDAVYVMMDSGTDDFIDRIPALALAHRLPAFGSAPELAAFGGLIGYGASREQLYLRTGFFVRKILDGAGPDDIPVEPPPRPALWINPRTASALDLSIPTPLLAVADKILQ
jgi:putative tryptophan/tyrosine transport system substrate-binding protein